MELKNKALIILILSIITFSVVLADQDIFVPSNYNDQNIYNISNITSDEYCNDTSCYTITELLVDTDTTYTNGTGISLVGNIFSLIGSFFSGIYSDLTGAPTLLSNFTDDLGDRGYNSLNNFTNDAGYYNSTDFDIDNYYNNITNFTGTLTNTKYCTYDSSQNIINCTSEGGASTTYYGGTGIEVNASNNISITLAYKIPQGCNNGEIAEYNTTASAWECGIDNTAASGMASWILVASDTIGSESITDGETVTVSDDNSYINITRSGSTIIISLYEAEIDARYVNIDGDNMTGNLNITGNITAEYFKGDGSLLTGISSSDNESWNETLANTLYAPINYGDNWNETYANTLYYGINNPSSYYNSTDFSIDDYYLNSNPSDYWNDTYATFNKTYADGLYAAIGTEDNSSWNQSLADTLYAPVNYGDDWNETYADTLYYGIANPSGFYNSSDFSITDYYLNSNPSEFYNSSDFAITDYYTSAEIESFNYYNSSDFAITDYYLNSNPSIYWNDTYATFNKTYADDLYYNIANPSGFYNSSDFSIGDYSTTAQAAALYYSIANPSGFYNSSDFSISDYYTSSLINGFNYYNATNFNITDYSTAAAANLLYAPINYGDDWNETYADTLYRADSWDNFTGIPHATPSDDDITHFSWANDIYDWAVGLFMQDLVDDTAPQLGADLDTNGHDIGATDDEIENIYIGDTTRIYFGDGQNASLYFNGTNLIISG